MDQQRSTELRRLFCCHSSFAPCCSVVVVRKGFNSLVGRRKKVTFDHRLQTTTIFLRSCNFRSPKIDSVRWTMGRGNLLPFPLPIMPPALSFSFSPASLRHKLRRREGSLHRVLGRFTVAPAWQNLAGILSLTTQTKKSHVVILIQAFRRNLRN